MKIILANKFYYNRGGDCIHVINLKRLLEKYGHEIAVFTMQHENNLLDPYGAFWPSKVEYSFKNMMNFKEALIRPVFSSEVLKKWTALLESFKPDLIHLHNIHTQLSPLIAKEAYRRSIPVYWTLHDYKLICPDYVMLCKGKVCQRCMDDPINVLKHLCVKNSVSGSILGFLEAKMWNKDKLQQYTTQFISPSGFMKNKMEEAGFKKEKISHLYNFINPDQFNYHFSKEDYFIYLGRIVKEKGIETLLKAAVANTRFKLKIIGDGPLRSELQQKYHRDNIQFLGYLNREKTEFLLGRAKFMVLPAEWYENNPLSIIESLTVGTPVLGADIGGIPEQIDPQNGRLFIPGNLNDLIEKIHFMNSFDWNYELISKTAIEKYSAQKYYEELIKIYQKTRGNELHSIPH